MKRFFTVFLILVVFSTCLNFASAQGVTIPDPNLAALIREALGLAPKEAITKRALQRLTELEAQGRQIENLTGLEHATNLVRLDVLNNQITDLTPIARLVTLSDLNFCSNPINNISPIAGLTNLTFLGFGCGGYITDISALANLRNLEHLFIGAGVVNDLTPLRNLKKLMILSICRNLINDLTPLENLENLKLLSIYGNPLGDLTPLENLKQLTWLALYENQISDISSLAGLTNLNALFLHQNRITDVSPLVGLVNLQGLRLLGNPVEDMSPLSKLPRLEGLDVLLEDDGVDWIPDNTLEGAIRGELFFQRMGFTLTKQTLRKLTHLQAINLQITDLTGLEHATQLQHLRLTGNRITDVSPLIGLTHLQYLDIGGNPNLNTDTLQTLRDQNPNLNITTDQSSPHALIDSSELPPMYWVYKKSSLYAPSGTLHRLTEHEVEILTPSIHYATGLAVDAANGKLYWIEQASDNAWKIQRANLNGSNVQRVKALSDASHSLAIDAGARKLYWVNTRGSIQRIDLNGQNFQPNFITGLQSPQSLAIDTVGRKLYWAEKASKTAGKIQRANLDGSNVQQVKALMSEPRYMAIDTAADKLYWVNAWGEIERMDLNGQNFQPNFITGLQSPQSLAIDTVGRKLYWTEPYSVRRADLNGGNLEDVVAGLAAPATLALPASTNTERAAPRNGSLAASETENPHQTRLLANYPNPFNPETWIPYELARSTDVQILIYDAHGTRVRHLELGHQPAGYYTGTRRAAYWDGRNTSGEPVASGIYFYQLLTNHRSVIRKMVVLK